MRAEPPIPFKHRMASRIFGSILFEAMRHLLAQTDARCPASEVVGHHLDRQPGGVGGEAARGEMVESDAVLEVSDAFSNSAWRRWSASSSRVSPSRSVMKP